ncbi:uncharacterized protein LOC129728180 [Wyeomyia smithii]|uniref:uncharacterized protein LOC129728180 n=1 Tax=Wyeomyia smithii TaxID=174621 RepID=UPI002467B597|nr:uncharacterized protein LOC129728180 [Wyeomyia smithii]
MADRIVELCENFTKIGLARECERRQIDSSGNNETMAKRILAHDATTVAEINEQDSRHGEEDFGDEHDGDYIDDDGENDKDDDDDKQNNDVSRHNDDGNNDDTSSSDGNSLRFRTAMHDAPTSTPRNTRAKPVEQRPYSFRDVEDSIESFGAEDGQDIKDWMLQFKTMSKTANWSDEQKMIMCRKKMTGTARRFVFAQRDLTSFTKLKNALIKEFAPFVRASDVHRKLAARKKKPTESTRDYIYEIQRIALAIDLDEASICEYVVDGITDDDFHRSLLYEAQSISQLKEKLLNFEKVQMKSTKKPRADDFGPKRKEHRKPEPRKESEKTDTKRHCYNCGEPSHVATDCPQKNDGPECFNCNAFGHVSKECTKKKEKKPAKVNVLKSVNSRKPSLRIKMNDIEISGIIDTGSEESLIRKDLWSRLAVNGSRLQKSNMKVRGYGGGVDVVIGETVLNAFVENEEHTICFYVVPCEAIDIPMLIGMDFLGKVDYAITSEGDCTSDDDITVPPKYREQVLELIENYKPETSVRPVNELRINLTDNEIVCEYPRRLAGLEKEVVKKQIDEWLDEGIIQPSTSEYASPIVVVPKKDGTRRVCVDYRQINKKVVRDKFPTPNVEEQIDQLSEARVYTTLDLRNSYFHVAIEESSRKYTSFVTNDGQYEFLRAPFGLCTSGNAFGRFISAVLKDLVKDGKVIAFVDDVIIPSKNEQEGIELLKTVLKVAEEAGLYFNWKKCAFLQRRVEYLGYTIYDGCIKPAPAKVEKLKQFPQPTTVKELQRFYGLASYFRRFIPAFASIARPLSGMLRKESCFDFDADAVAAFNRIKEILTSYPVLRIFCPGAETEVHTDASKVALAGILMQRAKDDGKFHPCYYYSRLTTGAEKNYHSYELETLAVVESLKKFRCYLLGYRFKIVTNCRAFKDTMMKRKMNARVARRVVDLAEFEYEIEHRSGEKMRHVDALFRADVLVVSASVTAQVRSAQADDDRVKAIIAELTQTDSSKEFSICNGVLYKGEDEARRLYVPECIEMTIIRNAHEKGHFGVKKTMDRIESEYFIPGVEDKIKR